MRTSEVIKKLNTMKNSAKPNAGWKLNCEKELVLLMKNFSPERKVSPWLAFTKIAFGSAKRMVLQPTVLLLLVLGSATGSSIVVNAAYYSLPGDALYPLKIRLERAQLAFMSDSNAKTELKVEFANKRIYEIDRIMLQPEDSQEKEKKVHIAVKTFKQNIQSVKDDVDNNMPEKEMSLKIALSLDSTGKELEKTFEKQEALGDDVKKSFENAKDITEDAGLKALMGSIAEPSATSIATTTKSVKNTEDIKDLVLQKILEIENKFLAVEKEYKDTLDENIANNISEIKKIFGKIQIDMEQGNLDAVLKNIQIAKTLLRSIVGTDEVSVSNENPDMTAVIIDSAEIED
ncbi:MAG: hypothetical protein US74_C0015G0021 [Parcubacteria group bacterium GW2011_GWA2_38_13]|nr:MAG: hypothetical protein US74_C0015G0021 [Parcubacteria group bacterium GW2011_GWA2_38_13]